MNIIRPQIIKAFEEVMNSDSAFEEKRQALSSISSKQNQDFNDELDLASVLHGDLIDSVGNAFSSIDSLSGKTRVGIYFTDSASNDCEIFNRSLIDSYEKLQSTEFNDFEIVQVTNAKTRIKWRLSLKNIPWKALPFRDPRNQELRELLGIDSMPSLIVVNVSDGSIITRDGVNEIRKDGKDAIKKWIK